MKTIHIITVCAILALAGCTPFTAPRDPEPRIRHTLRNP